MNFTEVFETIFQTNFTEEGNSTEVLDMAEEGGGGSDCYLVNDQNIKDIIYNNTERIITLFVMPIIAIIGVTGNLSIIYAFLRVKSLRTPTNYYLISLAITDLMFLCLTVPYLLKAYFHSPIRNDFSFFSQIGQKVYQFMYEMLLVASGFFVVVVSFERYLAICWPIKFRALRKASYNVVVCIVCWLLSSLLKLPSRIADSKQFSVPCITWDTSLKLTSYPKSYSWRTCDPEIINCEVIHVVDQVLYLLIIPIISVIFILIRREFKKLENSITAQKSSLERNQKVVRMLLVTVLFYVSCTSPVAIFQLVNAYYSEKLGRNLALTLYQVARIFSLVNSSANPIIYNLMSSNYRKSFLKAFPFIKQLRALTRQKSSTNGSQYKVQTVETATNQTGTETQDKNTK